jgi:hypothetical protein
MKTILLLLLASVCLSRAATINLNGHIQGRLNADYQNGNRYTLDFYFIEVPVTTTLSFNWCTSSGPLGRFGTDVDLRIAPFVNQHVDLTTISVLLGGPSCDSEITLFQPGNYVLSVSAGNGGWDGGGGIIAVDEAVSEFEYFDYQGTIRGEATLTAIWHGLPNNTFQITNIPEPGTLTALALSAFLLTPRSYVKPSSAA